jgi:uncharacterized membrane protein
MSKKNIGTLLIILLFGLLLRCAELSKHRYWIDEAISVANAVGIGRLDIEKNRVFTAQQIWASPAGTQANCVYDDSGNGILHTLLLKKWIDWVGFEEKNARLLSVFWGFCCILLTFWLGKKLFTTKIGLTAAFLVALHPILIEYSREMRSYSQATALFLFATIVLVEQLAKWKRATYSKVSFLMGWLVYAVLIGLVFCTHYLACLMFLVHGLIVLAYADLKLCLIYALTGFLGLGFCSIWYLNGGAMGFERMQSISTGYALNAQDMPFQALSARNMVGGILQAIIFQLGIYLQYFNLQIRHFIWILCFFVLLMSPLKKITQKTHPDYFWARALIFLAFNGLFFSVILAFQAKHMISMTPKYSIWCLPFLCLLLALCWVENTTNTTPPKKISTIIYKIAGCFVLIIWSVGYFKVFLDKDFNRKDSNKLPTIKKEILAKADISDTIVFTKKYDAVLFNLYIDKDNKTSQTIRLDTTPIKNGIYNTQYIILVDSLNRQKGIWAMD